MNTRLRHTLGAAVLLALLGAAAWVGLRWLTAPQLSPEVKFVALDGRAGTLAQWRGQVVLVNFWATSCSSCVAEMPELIATHQKFASHGYQTLAVAMSYDPPAYVAHFAQSRQLPFTVAIDNTGLIAQSFPDVRLTPTTFLINKKGEIVKRYVGAPNFADLHALIEKLMREA